LCYPQHTLPLTTPTMTTPHSPSIEQWDLTSAVSPFLDRHMVFPLLEYLDTLINDKIYSYSSKDVAAARLCLLRPTHMVDYAIDIAKELGDDVREMEEQKAKVYEELAKLRAGCAALSDLCKNEVERAKLVAEGNWNAAGLASSANIDSQQIETYRTLAKYNFECGDYQASRDMLTDYISLLASPPAPKNEDDDYTNVQANEQQKQNSNIGNKDMFYLKEVNLDLLQVLWGKLACEILVEDYKAASTAVDATRTAVELLVTNKELSPLRALEQRTWLLHWSLFVYWQVGGLEHLVDLCFSDRYRQAITTHAPHLLRYLTAAVLLCKRTDRRLLKSLIQVMQDCDYTDPIVEFVNCLCVKFDFDQAQLKLQECESVLKSDFFLCKQTGLFMEEARVFVFENYCRIHNKIDLAALGEKLAMDQKEAERWIVDLIRNADFDAKIDADCVVMGASTQSVYEQVMERTRDLNVRSATLAQNLKTALNEARKEKSKRERAAMED